MRPTEQSYGSTSPFDDQTTHQTDFAPKPPQQPREAFRPTDEYKRSPKTATGPFDDQTTHQTDFAPKPPQQPREAFRPTDEYKRNPAKTATGGDNSSNAVAKRYDYLTIMKRDFPEHTGHKPESSYKPKQGYRPTG